MEKKDRKVTTIIMNDEEYKKIKHYSVDNNINMSDMFKPLITKLVEEINKKK